MSTRAMPNYVIRPIEPRDEAAVATIIRKVMPEFGAVGEGFAINDPEVDWMHRAYSTPRRCPAAMPIPASCARCTSCRRRVGSVPARR